MPRPSGERMREEDIAPIGLLQKRADSVSESGNSEDGEVLMSKGEELEGAGGSA